MSPQAITALFWGSITINVVLLCFLVLSVQARSLLMGRYLKSEEENFQYKANLANKEKYIEDLMQNIKELKQSDVRPSNDLFIEFTNEPNGDEEYRGYTALINLDNVNFIDNIVALPESSQNFDEDLAPEYKVSILFDDGSKDYILGNYESLERFIETAKKKKAW